MNGEDRQARPRDLVYAAGGLVVSSSGTSVKRGDIPRPAMQPPRLLVEAAWSYRFPAQLSRELLLRQESQPKLIRDIAWKGQL